LQPDGPGFGASRVAGVLHDGMAIEEDFDQVVADLDFHAVPVAEAFVAGFGILEEVQTAGRILLGLGGEDLDLIADVGGGALTVMSSAAGEGRTGGVADRDARVGVEPEPVFETKVELAVFLLGVELGLVYCGAAVSLAGQDLIGGDIPDPVADFGPTVEGRSGGDTGPLRR